MKYNCKKLSVFFAAVMMFVLACPVTVLAAAEEEAGTPAVYATFWSLIPPVVAIVLALITKEVYSSLFVGILVGGLFYSGFSFEGTIVHIFEDGIIGVLSDSYNVGILVFLIILGAIVCLMNKAGGSAAFGRWASDHIKTRTGAQTEGYTYEDTFGAAFFDLTDHSIDISGFVFAVITHHTEVNIGWDCFCVWEKAKVIVIDEDEKFCCPKRT